MRVRALPDRNDGVRILEGEGELDVASVPTVMIRLPELVAGAAAVVLDLSSVAFFDSAGVRMVDQLARVCNGAGTPFRVAAPPQSASRRVLEIVGMDPLLADDLPSAVATVRPAS